jgi:hypothetical protein
MRRALFILLIGLVGAVAAYCALYFHRTARHREVADTHTPELAWLRQEYHLNDTEFRRITELHENYLPRCEEMCRKIAQKNGEMKALASSTNVDSTALQLKLAEAAQLRLECQSNMLSHFIAVSKQMPPEQGRRYLQWIQEKTFLRGSDMMDRH